MIERMTMNGKRLARATSLLLGSLMSASICLLTGCQLLRDAAGENESKTGLQTDVLTYEELEAEAEGFYGEDWLAEVNAAEKGDILTFGFFEQDSDPGNGREPIE